MEKTFFVYIATNRHRTVIYIGFTNNLATRIDQHRNKTVSGFTSKYQITDLIYFETFVDAITAINREKQLKGWRREKKISLIKEVNPKLEEVYL